MHFLPILIFDAAGNRAEIRASLGYSNPIADTAETADEHVRNRELIQGGRDLIDCLFKCAHWRKLAKRYSV